MSSFVPPLIEHLDDGSGRYTREWYCVPPDDGTPFRVLRGEWTEDFAIQRIYEVELIP